MLSNVFSCSIIEIVNGNIMLIEMLRIINKLNMTFFMINSFYMLGSGFKQNPHFPNEFSV